MTRHQFYRSKEWETLVEQLRIERADENGNVICAHCGKPIVKRYDCIGHHKIELTDENVNDYQISLNPENVELIHFRCHNEIHGRFGNRQNVYLVYGAPCAGKTTFVHDQANNDDLILDLDKIWVAICTSDREHKPNRLKANVFGIRDCIIDQIRTRTGNWRNAYIIGTYPLRTDRDRLCEMLQAQPVFIDTSMKDCMDRAPNESWLGYISDWFLDFVP